MADGPFAVALRTNVTTRNTHALRWVRVPIRVRVHPVRVHPGALSHPVRCTAADRK